MIWFFERGEQRLRCEIRCAQEGSWFELVWQTPDGETHIERSEDSAALDLRRKEIEEQLERDGWKGLGGAPADRRFL